MTTRQAGRDGRSLVDTTAAAYSLGMKPGSFRGWAVRHHIKHTSSRPNPNGGQATALWDLADIAQALDKHSAAA
jgi:hypothetical protein